MYREVGITGFFGGGGAMFGAISGGQRLLQLPRLFEHPGFNLVSRVLNLFPYQQTENRNTWQFPQERNLCFKTLDRTPRCPQKIAHEAFGETQLKRMLADRPQTAACASKGDAVWEWTVRQFAGEGAGSRIYWQSNPPDGDCPVCHHPPDGRSAGNIRLRSTDRAGVPRTGEALWSHAVFELYNIRNAAQFHKVNDDAVARTISRDEYIREYFHAEFDAHGTRERATAGAGVTTTRR
jgi:hypothetical protein